MTGKRKKGDVALTLMTWESAEEKAEKPGLSNRKSHSAT